MDQQQNEIYSELRKTKQELIENLEGGGKSFTDYKVLY